MTLSELVLAALAVAGCWYAAACAGWPLVPCWSCSGSGEWRSLIGGRGRRKCPRCKGTGRRFRAGVRAWAALTTSRRRGAR